METIESSETSAYNNTLTPGTYPKEEKLQSKHGESLKSRLFLIHKLVDWRVLETNMQSAKAACTVCLYRNCVKGLTDSTVNVFV